MMRQTLKKSLWDWREKTERRGTMKVLAVGLLDIHKKV